ncbi:MAG TPA: transcription antitermination factor NusB [Rhizomicrobium sp.]|nr:transcription antitermination factor NusB [Rhizomicrobium sp.]
MAFASAGIPARAAAQSILGEVLRKRRPLDDALDAVLARAALEPRDAGFARAIAAETLRRLGQLQALVHAFAKPPPQHRAGQTLELLLAGACELLFLNVPPHAAVDAANELAIRDSKAVHFKPLINAVLRRISREGAAAVSTQDAARLNTPDWLWFRWCETYGQDTARAIAEAHLAQPPLDLHPKPEAIPQPEGERIGDIVRLNDAGSVEALLGFTQGTWWVQDFAASLPVRLMGNVRAETVIDLCAAPGGKCAQLAAAGASVIAVERDPMRMQRLRKNLERLHLPAQLVEADVRDFRPGERIPFVLLDAPCSATGTIRRHPDLPWIKSAADVNTCADAAAELLDAAADMVADNGLLVFAVCSLEPEEGPEQVAAFLDGHPQFQRDPVQPGEVFDMAELIRDGDLRTLPCHLRMQGGMDGFYAARLKRSG